MKSKNINLDQEAVNFASNRKLGAGHGYPSFTANLLEKGFKYGAKKSLWVKKEKLKFAKKILLEVSNEETLTGPEHNSFYDLMDNISNKLIELDKEINKL